MFFLFENQGFLTITKYYCFKLGVFVGGAEEVWFLPVIYFPFKSIYSLHSASIAFATPQPPTTYKIPTKHLEEATRKGFLLKFYVMFTLFLCFLFDFSHIPSFLSSTPITSSAKTWYPAKSEKTYFTDEMRYA